MFRNNYDNDSVTLYAAQTPVAHILIRPREVANGT